MNAAYVMNARLLAGLASLSCWLCLAALASVLMTHYPTNHIALDVRVCYVVGVLALVACLLARAGTLGPIWVWSALASGVLLILAVFVLDQWNMLVGYEVWLNRGQPLFGTVLE